MPWLVLLVSAVLEAVWATALGASDGFTRPLATGVFLVAVVLSMLGLGYAAKHIPISTAYAVWTGLGAALTVTYAMLTGEEAVTVWRVVFLAGVVGAVIGLKLVRAPAGSGGPAQVE
ncbi:QacE family quaternary ammonium compound efflux SMR transporter [Auraticoccus sp. F435]|uniref:QacE family quaternary ammonium compound efflux SMR transporter n=1 Tax=Auraticoccus cholistanensis TaxID=2656650 RepID=A0A6A9UUN6_9ACTN|nr:multidrug efflux SMR transporter [Auraticoccus cholistanensis]MVA76646.1 QacE family quaternary ammonium compound efflux SMR transporter [Auraticoccus cholistanensis]